MIGTGKTTIPDLIPITWMVVAPSSILTKMVHTVFGLCIGRILTLQIMTSMIQTEMG